MLGLVLMAVPLVLAVVLPMLALVLSDAGE
jgi:hypothetical protein